MEYEEEKAVLDILYSEDFQKEFLRNKNYNDLQDYAKLEFIREVKEYLSSLTPALTITDAREDGEIIDFVSEWVDSHVEIYTGELFKWIYENSNLSYLANDVIADFGIPDKKEDILVKLIQLMQYKLLEDWAYEIIEEEKNKKKGAIQ
jgi:hypothetical protein